MLEYGPLNAAMKPDSRESTMIKIPDAILTASGTALLLLSFHASAASLALPSDATVLVQVVDNVEASANDSRLDDLLLRSAGGHANTSHTLPEYCVVVANARPGGERLQISTQSLTCIETDGSDSDIYSGEISAAAYELDDSYGLAVCESGRCELAPGHSFMLKLASPLEISEQDNPSARINEQRRQANGEGVANPIPADRPDPDQEQ